MKKKLFSYALVCAMGIAGLLSSCTSKPSGAALLPDDAMMVWSLDVKAAVEASGVEGNEHLMKELEKGVKQAGMPCKIERKVLELIENPMEAGVDLTEPLFCAIVDMDNEKFAFTGNLSDAAKFEDLVEMVASEVEKDARIRNVSRESDIKYMQIDRDGFLLFSQDRFMLCNMGRDEDEDDFLDEMAELFVQEEGYNTTSGYQKLMDEPGIIKMHLAFDELLSTKDMKREMRNVPREAKETLRMLEDVDAIMALNIVNGEATLVCEVDVTSEETKALYDELAAGLGDIEGSFLPYFDEDDVLVAAVNFDGEKYLDVFENRLKDLMEKLSKQQRDMVMDAIESVNGDLTFGFGGELLEGGEGPCVSLYGATSNDYIVNLVAHENAGDDDMVKSGKSEWYIPLKDSEYTSTGETYYDEYWNEWRPKYEWVYKEVGRATFGIRDNVSYFCTSEEKPELFEESSSPVNKSDFVGKKLYARLNVSAILEMDEVKEGLSSGDGYMVRKVLEKVELLELVCENNYRVTLRLKTKDKSETPIATLLDLVSEML